MDLKKVTWTTSTRIHATYNGETTLCGHVFLGSKPTIHGKLHKKKKNHCKTCFFLEQDFKAKWLELCTN